VYNAAQHETTAKTFSFPIYADGRQTIPARSATDGLQDGTDLIARSRQPDTARYLATKLYRFFVTDSAPSTSTSWTTSPRSTCRAATT